MHIFNWQTISRGLAAIFAVSLAQFLAGHVQAADYNVGSIHITHLGRGPLQRAHRQAPPT